MLHTVVCVLPAPVWPYAMQLAAPPSRTYLLPVETARRVETEALGRQRKVEERQ